MNPLRRCWHQGSILCRYVVAWTFTLLYCSLACLTVPFLGGRRMWLVFCGPWARTTLKILGIRPVVANPERMAQPAVYVANHQSILDVILLPAILPAKVLFVARRELGRIPLWGWAFVWGGAITIERKGRGGDGERIAKALASLPEGWSVVIFPEGTRRKSSLPGPFRRGAFLCAAKLGCPVVPVGVAFQRPGDPAGSWLLRRGTVPVHVGEPFMVENQSAEALHAARTQAHLAVSRGVALAGELASACAEARIWCGGVFAASGRPRAQAKKLSLSTSLRSR